MTIQVPTQLRACCGGASEVSVPAARVGDALAQLKRRYPELHRSICDETGAVRRHIGVFVNLAHVREREGVDTALAPGDVVIVLPAVSGG